MNEEVIIVGGGVVGLTAALAMHHQGFSVALLDAGPLYVDPLLTSPRVYAINHASQQLLQRLHVWEHLETSRVSPYQHMYVWDDAKHAHIDFDARMIASERLGFFIDESNLRGALLHEIATQSIQLFPESAVTSLKELPDSIEIYSNARHWSAKLMIVADGALSPTRELLGVSLTSWPYHQQALVATVATEMPHQQTAYQVFNSNGTLAFLPLSDPHQCSIVWSSAPRLTEQRMMLSEEMFNQQLTTAFEGKLGQTKVISKRFSFPLQMRHVKQYCGAHWILMGDSAHTIHPLAGLGLNVGLADVTAWLTLLNGKKNNLCSKKVLRAYQRQRKHAVWLVIALMEGLKAIFLSPLFPIISLRSLGLNRLNQLIPLKRLFIGHAEEMGTE